MSVSATQKNKQYDTCKDKSIEFCIEEEKPPVFDYEPKVVKRKPKKKKKIAKIGKRDKTIHFRKGEIDKDIEMLGFSGKKAVDTIASEGFDPNKDYFIEDQSGPDEILVDGLKVRVRKLTRSPRKASGFTPTGKIMAGKGGTSVPMKTTGGMRISGKAKPITGSGKPSIPKDQVVVDPSRVDKVAQVSYKRVFAKDASGKMVARKVKVTTYVSKGTLAKSQAPKKKTFWGNMQSRYQNFRNNVIRPRYRKARAKLKSLFNRYFKRK